MKKKNLLIVSAAGLVALATVAGAGFWTYAQANGAVGWPGLGWMWGGGKFLTQDQLTQIEAMKKTNVEKLETAMSQGYTAWVAAVKDLVGTDAPILSKITADNFSKYAAAYIDMKSAQEMMEKARAEMQELGLDGFGSGEHGGRMKGSMKGWERGWMNTNANTSGTSNTETQ